MDAVEDIKSRLSIEDVVSEYVQLKRAGSNFKGLSPFTNEKTPSLMVSSQKQIWHDFSSGKGGNMFSFIMEMEGLDFKGALELLARKSGIDLSQYRDGRGAETNKIKEQLYKVNALATKFYQVQFSRSQTALEYVFKKRAINKQTALAFCLGYAPNTGDALAQYLKKQHISEDMIQKAGLATRRYGSFSDMFRGRLMVPLMDQQGQVIGFTARLLQDDPNAPKYINTPQSLLYDKSRHVFGLHLAKESIRREGFVVVAEGNLDVIASHQVGVKHVVATAGTAMTEQHLKILSRFTSDIRLAFDQDQAGQAAAERTIPLASKLNLSLGIIAIPEGKDPDELIRRDPTKWTEAINNKQYIVDWLIDRYQKTLQLDSAEGKRKFSDKILATVRHLQDPVEQDHYVHQLAQMLHVSADALRAKLRVPEATPRLRKRSSTESTNSIHDIEYQKIQDHLLSICLFDSKLREHLYKITEQMLVSADAKTLLQFIHDYPEYDGSLDRLGDKQAKVRSRLQQIADYVKIIRLQYETLYLELDELERAYEAARLEDRLIEHYVKAKKTDIASQLRDADETKTKALLESVRDLDLLRKR
jgi:DNA primase